MRDVLTELATFRDLGERVCRAVLTGIVGSAPRPEGAAMIMGEGGSIPLAALEGRMAPTVEGH